MMPSRGDGDDDHRWLGDCLTDWIGEFLALVRGESGGAAAGQEISAMHVWIIVKRLWHCASMIRQCRIGTNWIRSVLPT